MKISVLLPSSLPCHAEGYTKVKPNHPRMIRLYKTHVSKGC